MTDLASIKTRVEEAKGPDRDLDLDIARVLCLDVVVMRRDRETGQNVPYTYWEWTGSIDHSVSLVEMKLPGWAWGIVKKGGEFEGYVHNNESAFIGISATPNPNRVWITARHNTPALAIIAALLSALSQKDTHNG